MIFMKCPPIKKTGPPLAEAARPMGIVVENGQGLLLARQFAGLNHFAERLAAGVLVGFGSLDGFLELLGHSFFVGHDLLELISWEMLADRLSVFVADLLILGIMADRALISRLRLFDNRCIVLISLGK